MEHTNGRHGMLNWKNYIGSIELVLVIILDYLTRCDMTEGLTAANNHNILKYQAIQISLEGEA